MPIAEITVSIPEDIWLAEITGAHPTASFEVIEIQEKTNPFSSSQKNWVLRHTSSIPRRTLSQDISYPIHPEVC